MRLSHSSIDVYSKCKKWFFLSKIKKVPVPIDDRHMRRGNVFHSCAEYIVNNSECTIEQVKAKFEEVWKEKKLDVDFKEKKDETYLMAVNFFNSHPLITSTELMVMLQEPEFIGYIDALDTNSDQIYDWKTSTFMSGHSEFDYKDQMGRYSLLYYKKFGRLPKKCTVYFIKYFPHKTVEYTFSLEDVQKYEKEIIDVNAFIEGNKANENAFTCCDEEGGECHIFCPYGNICKNLLSYKLNTIGNYVQIEGSITELLNKGLNKKFSYELKNAHWIKKNYPMANTTVRFWRPNQQILPIGFRNGLIKTLEDYSSYTGKKLNLEHIDNRVFNLECYSNMPEKLLTRTLRDYQNDAVDEFIKQKVGVLELPTGSGKTDIFIELCRRLNYKTLIVVGKLDLLNQTKERLERELGIEIGKIGQGETDIKTITVATIQTLTKNIKEFSPFLKMIRFVVFDEAHHLPSKSMWKLSQYLINTEYRLGTTATNWSESGDEMYIEAICGKTCYNITSQELIDKGYLTQPNIIFIKDYMDKSDEDAIEAKCKTGLINEQLSYNTCYTNFIALNEKRNNVILSLVEKHKDKKILILTKLVEHGAKLAEQLKCPHLWGGTPKEEREQILLDINNGKVNLLVSSVQIFSEGLDVPSLEIIINASGNKSSIKSIQMLGRIMRIFSEKKSCIFYDFIDNNRFFRLASYSRMKIFRKYNYEIEVIGNKDD